MSGVKEVEVDDDDGCCCCCLQSAARCSVGRREKATTRHRYQRGNIVAQRRNGMEEGCPGGGDRPGKRWS